MYKIQNFRRDVRGFAAQGPACRAPNSPLRIVRFLGESQVRYYLSDDARKYGSWLREEMTHMGPAFIKLGQFLSTRSDLFDKHITSELERLQDDITPVPFDDLVYILDDHLPTWKTVFSSIDPQPIACASIGQVHLGVLAKSGKKVVLKVQKPCVADSIRKDLATLESINHVLTQMNSPRAKEVEGLLIQYERFLAAELNYTQEMRHMQIFAKTLEDLPVKVPHVYEEYCSESLLVMEYVPSVKITDMESLRKRNINGKDIADKLVAIFLHMMVTDGIIHVDAHPGNLGVMEDGETIALYDYGNVVQLNKSFRSQIGNLVFSVYQKDVDEFVDLLLTLKILQIQNEEDILDIRTFFQSFFRYLETMDFASLKNSIVNTSTFGETFGTNVKIDPDFLSLFRVFALLDGTCSKLDPTFNYIDAITPFSEELMSDLRFFDYRAKKDLQKLQTYSGKVQSTDQNVLRVQRQVRELNGSLQQMRMGFIGFCLWSILTTFLH